MSVIVRPVAPAHSPDRSGQRPDIQGLRAVAVVLVAVVLVAVVLVAVVLVVVVLVVAHHADLPVPAGFAGVDVFFVISGFVITGSCSGGRRPGRSRSAGSTDAGCNDSCPLCWCWNHR